MSHLVEVYAKDLGVKVGNPVFKPHFYPILEENYITIHNDKKVQAKDYEYWEEVILLVKSKAPDLKFIQIGNGQEPQIKLVDKFIPTNSIKQSAYIIKNSLMHVGTDSVPVHIASALNKPIVALYSHANSSTCDPVWGDKENHTVIESHRNGNKPSYSFKEYPKTINFIKPEEIANAILKKLGREECQRETLYVGRKYKEKIIHIVPDNKYAIKGNNLIIRLDLLHNEENVLHLFSQNKTSVLTEKPVSDEILSKPNIDNISYFSEDFDEDFILRAKQKGVNLRLFCTKEENLADMRFKFFDEDITFYKEENKINEAKEIIDLENEEFEAKSYSLYMKDGEAFPSKYEAYKKENLNDIYVDLAHLMIYKNSHE